MTTQKAPPKKSGNNALGGGLVWVAEIGFLWALTFATPTVLRALVDAKVETLNSPGNINAIALITGTGAILGLVWRGVVQKTALGIALLVVLGTAAAGYICAAVVGVGYLSAAKAPVYTSSSWIWATAFAVLSALFVAIFAVRRVHKSSAWWLFALAAALAAPLAFL